MKKGRANFLTHQNEKALINLRKYWCYSSQTHISRVQSIAVALMAVSCSPSLGMFVFFTQTQRGCRNLMLSLGK